MFRRCLSCRGSDRNRKRKRKRKRDMLSQPRKRRSSSNLRPRSAEPDRPAHQRSG